MAHGRGRGLPSFPDTPGVPLSQLTPGGILLPPEQLWPLHALKHFNHQPCSPWLLSQAAVCHRPQVWPRSPPPSLTSVSLAGPSPDAYTWAALRLWNPAYYQVPQDALWYLRGSPSKPESSGFQVHAGPMTSHGLHTPAPWNMAGQTAQSLSGVWEPVGVVMWPLELPQRRDASHSRAISVSSPLSLSGHSLAFSSLCLTACLGGRWCGS